MCGRYRMSAHPMVPEIFRIIGIPFPLDGFVPRYNIAPMQVATVLLHDHGAPRLEPARWGFVPLYERSPKPKLRPINAKSETVATSGMFRQAFAQKRCLVPATGFYEWEGEAKAKRPVLFEHDGGAPFCFAGIWSRWQPGPEHPVELTFTILTTAAYPPVSDLHDRGPVVVLPDDYDRWLVGPDPAALLHAPPAGFFGARRVSTFVNNVRNEGPACDAPSEG